MHKYLQFDKNDFDHTNKETLSHQLKQFAKKQVLIETIFSYWNQPDKGTHNKIQFLRKFWGDVIFSDNQKKARSYAN